MIINIFYAKIVLVSLVLKPKIFMTFFYLTRVFMKGSHRSKLVSLFLVSGESQKSDQLKTEDLV